eukprot:CAMPEP_0168276000 /NCGR_PEP_ID=MMETSP0141_2-20121125/18260_1 /TAXON_ID=44445 /ORGANISM="Pseudo-nitzschia australis, Strain 10249 10 AB" /LENGTH=152 /DNA_ID=CAMNT_0008217949 /DNA_START=38 /DNA_END=493 /DNA_ORIENTATION=-
MSIANTNTNTSAYNLEDEELYLESYLKRTTAFSIERKQDGDDANATAPVNWDDDDDQHKHQHQHHRNDETKTDTRKNNNNNDDDFVGRRVYCCNTSRSLYCPECCRVLIPNIRNNTMRIVRNVRTVIVVEQVVVDGNDDYNHRRRRPFHSNP